MAVDSHAHLGDEKLFSQLEAIAERARGAGVEQLLNICTDRVTLERGREMSARHPWIYLAAATTPHDVERHGEADFPFFEHAAAAGELVAIGETGLDYHYSYSPKDLQQKFLKKYLKLALSLRLPVIIHCREAFADLFSILDAEYRLSGGAYGLGVLHCFTGTLQEAKEVIRRGWMLSLSGILTFKKSLELQEVARFVPLDHLLIETDAPYLAPQKYRGQINEPAFLMETASCLAHLKELSIQECLQATAANAQKLFGLPLPNLPHNAQLKRPVQWENSNTPL